MRPPSTYGRKAPTSRSPVRSSKNIPRKYCSGKIKKARSMIHFGTSGWRAVIAEEFTFENVRKVVHAIATHLRNTSSSPAVSGGGSIMMGPRQGHSGATMTGAPVIVGYDTRFLSPEL